MPTSDSESGDPIDIRSERLVDVAVETFANGVGDQPLWTDLDTEPPRRSRRPPVDSLTLGVRTKPLASLSSSVEFLRLRRSVADRLSRRSERKDR